MYFRLQSYIRPLNPDQAETGINSEPKQILFNYLGIAWLCLGGIMKLRFDQFFGERKAKAQLLHRDEIFTTTKMAQAIISRSLNLQQLFSLFSKFPT